MSGEQRLLLAFEMSMFARELNRSAFDKSIRDLGRKRRIDRELLRLTFLPSPLPDLQ